MSTPDHDTAAQQLNDAKENLSGLIRAELALMQNMIAASLRRLIVAVGVLVCAVVVILVALNVLAATAVLALIDRGFEPVWAGLIVGLGLVLFAAVMVKIGLRILAGIQQRATRSARNVERDLQAVRTAFNEQ